MIENQFMHSDGGRISVEPAKISPATVIIRQAADPKQSELCLSTYGNISMMTFTTRTQLLLLIRQATDALFRMERDQ